MDMNNRPHGRKKTVTGGSKGVHRRGSGLGTGSHNSKSYSGRSRKTVTRAAGGGGGTIVLLLVLFLASKILGVEDSDSGTPGSYNNNSSYNNSSYDESYHSYSGGKADYTVAKGSRSKRTNIIGNNKDEVTIMVYLCGTDLESKSGMASADLEEMRAASKSFGKGFNLIVYTGGCKEWKNGISSAKNQIYKVESGKINLLDEESSKAMTDPDTLSGFIKYCTKNYPANRQELILWDHGGGSVSGFGYDEKNASKGSMGLAGISKAIGDSGTYFDFIGFDACLMATAENALMLDPYADYLIASEETEPGIGWYYTNWLKEFAKDKSMATVDIGKRIVDDFVGECNSRCRGQKTTLSVIDLAEFSNTIPSDLSLFSRSVTELINNEEYKTVSDARYATREFAQSSKIDQVDLVDLANKMKTSEGKALAKSIKSAVKYNRTSSNMTNAYGVSIYFPYKRTSYVDKACDTYERIGMDMEYADCIRQFASLETSGQIAAGGTGSPVGSLFGLGTDSSPISSELIGNLLGAFLGGSGKNIEGLDDSNTAFMEVQDTQKASSYIAENSFDASKLVWTQSGSKYTMTLPESQWELVHALDRNMFYYDGEGWVDLGIDNTFEFGDNGELIADTAKDWVAINGQPVAYYHTDSVENADGTYMDMGYVPAYLNGDRVKLIIVFDDGDGYIAGAVDDYRDGQTETVAKYMFELKNGDSIDFVCDFYTDDMVYQDSYYLGETMKVTDNMKISNVSVGSGEVRIMYCFTDIYNREYWTEAIVR